MTNGKLIILSAPSGSGKSTIINEVLKQGLPMKFSISATSRPARGQEKHGVEYYFHSPEEFRAKIANNEFLEYEEVYPDRFYGTLKSEVEKELKNGCNIILDVDVAGGLNIKKLYGEQALLIFIMPPSIEELKRRLEKRGTDSSGVIADRISKAAYEMSLAPHYDKIVVNDDLNKAITETINIITNFVHS
ncbi:guanylate kinase [Bacteroidales bacterium OttesenSCG-928-M06]|nr:guanylate kinase [Bacteroidales bacterium OttesenSCG-928-M06]